MKRSLFLLLLLPHASRAAEPDGILPVPEGFTSLIGKDLSNWSESSKLAPNWKVDNGLLINDGKGANAYTGKSYRNFELRLDWKIPKSGDSGVYLPGGQQIQIHARDQSGAFVWNHKTPIPPLVQAANPLERWNTFKIVLQDGKATVHLNGKLTMDAAPVEKGFDPPKAGPAEGPIGLQRSPHAKTTTFRNIFIKELPAKRE